MQCPVIYVGRYGFAFFARAAPVLLFLGNPMLSKSSACGKAHLSNLSYLRCSDYTLLLNAFSDGTASDTVQVWIRSKAFPIPATSYYSSNGSDEWTQGDVDPLASVLLSKSLAILEHKPSIEGCSKMNTSRES